MLAVDTAKNIRGPLDVGGYAPVPSHTVMSRVLVPSETDELAASSTVAPCATGVGAVIRCIKDAIRGLRTPPRPTY